MIGIANVVMAHWVRTSHEGPAEPLQGERPTATTELHQAGVPVGPMADALSVMVKFCSRCSTAFIRVLAHRNAARLERARSSALSNAGQPFWGERRILGILARCRRDGDQPPWGSRHWLASRIKAHCWATS